MDISRRDAIGLAMAAAIPGVAGADKARRAAVTTGTVSDLGLPPAWFTAEPMRISWNILRQVDGHESGTALIEQAAANDINLVVITAGGVVAFYPTRIPYHQRSDGARAGNDLFGDASRAAKARGLRVGARFDFSRLSGDALRDHPEWFYKRLDGSHSGAQGRYRPCINSEYYHKIAPAIVMELFALYQPSLLFLNNFTNVSGTGEPAPCQCDNCKMAWAAVHPGSPLPAQITPEYGVFIKDRTRLTAELIELPLRRRHPEAVIINADSEPSDGLHTESRTAFPTRWIWPYETAEAVDRQRNSRPDKLCLSICNTYSTNYSRLVVMPAAETRTRLFQAVAAGSHPIVSMTGTLAQYDREMLAAAHDVWGWYKRNGDLYVGQRNAARALLLCRPSLANRVRESAAETSERGLYQILAENHVPLAAAETTAPLRERRGHYDVVLVSRGAPLDGVRDYVAAGGTAVFADQHPGFAMPEPAETLELSGSAYWRIRNRDQLPGFPSVDFVAAGGIPADAPPSSDPAATMRIMIRGGGVTLHTYPNDPDALLTLVPPMIENIAEEAAADMHDTDIPGLLVRRFGKGRVVMIPWDLGGLYARFHFSQHAQLLMSILRGPGGWSPELVTDAPAAVHMLLMEQPGRDRKLLNLVNLAGQSQRGYDEAPLLPQMQITLNGRFSAAESRAMGRSLPIRAADGRTIVTLPQLRAFDSLVLTV